MIETDQQKRHDNFLAHAKHIMADMPDTYAYIAEILLDAYVVSTENKFRLIVDFETNDEVYSYQSLQPVEQSLFGGRVAEFYRHLNGFCDMNFFGGMLPISHITPITEAEFYTEPSASLYKKPEYADFVEIFSSERKRDRLSQQGSTFDDDPIGWFCGSMTTSPCSISNSGASSTPGRRLEWTDSVIQSAAVA